MSFQSGADRPSQPLLGLGWMRPWASISIFLLVLATLYGCDATGSGGNGAGTVPSELATEIPEGNTAAPEPVAEVEPREDGLPCAPGSRCFVVDKRGSVDPDGDFIAQCTSQFPDYVVEASHFPADFRGPWFSGAFDYPAEEPAPAEFPWAAIDFTDGVQGANDYLYALRDYAFEGNTEVDFRVQENAIRPWYVVPYMNFGSGRRELVHGVTKERPVRGPELGLREDAEIDNYGIGFYNDLGGFGIGSMWQHPLLPDLTKNTFPNGTMVFKILFTDAVAEDFEDPDGYILEGAPEWQIATGDGELTTVRLLQMDVAARDPRAQPSEWVFGTFAYDRDADDANPWNRLRPVGLSWGNAPGYTPANQEAGDPLPENTVSDQIPAYAADHLGWAGRVNGPVDNPISSCHSCHGVAQFPVKAAMAPFSRRCDTDEKKLHWFRNIPAGEAFGAVDRDTCEPEEGVAVIDLDFSMQIKVALQSILQFRNNNPCFEGEVPDMPGPEEMGISTDQDDAPEIGRGGFIEADD